MSYTKITFNVTVILAKRVVVKIYSIVVQLRHLQQLKIMHVVKFQLFLT